MLADFTGAGKRKKAFGAFRIRGHLARFLQATIDRRRDGIDGAHRLAKTTTFQRSLHIRQHGHKRVGWRLRRARVERSTWMSGHTGRSRRSQSRLRDRADHPNTGKAQPERKYSEQ